MSDSGKELKLAAARSKLQQFRNRRSRVKEAIKAASASGGCSGAESQASTELSSRASSYDPLNDADHLEVTSLVAPVLQQDAGSAPVAGLGLPDAIDFNAEVVENLEDRSGDHSTAHPAYRTAASLFADTQSSSADDFLADSVRFANGDASFPQSVPHVLSQGVSDQQTMKDSAGSHDFSANHNTSHSRSNSNGAGKPLINIVSNYFSSSSNAQSSFPNLSPSETTSLKPVTSSTTHAVSPKPTSGSQDLSVRSCERDSSLESIRSAATAIHQPQLVVTATSSASQGSESVMLPSPSLAGDQNSAASLREISKQLQGLVNEADRTGPIQHGEEVVRQSEESREQIRELEARNTSQVNQLEQQKLLITQQQGQLQELSSMLQASHAQAAEAAAAAASAAESSNGRSCAEEELTQVRQQLHLHVQTIGILVAEKTQLESQLHEAREQLSGRGDQGKEAETKLVAARRKVEEVEAALVAKEAQVTALTSEKDGLQSQLHLAKEERDRFKLRCSDHELRAAELAERVSSSSKDQHSLQAQLTETKTQLHMANIRVEQLRNSSGDSANILDELNQEKRAHQAAQDQLCEVRQQLAQAQAEKNQVAAQYQLYTNQLAQQAQQIQEQLATSEQERQQLQNSIQEHQQQVQELQKLLLQHQQSAHVDAASAEQVAELQGQLQRMGEQVQKLDAELQEARDNNKKLEDNNLSLHQLSEQLQQQVERLELSLDKQQTESVDSSGLLAKLQSDKVAAARALAQNRMLKEQLAELQDGFVLMSNKKLELTEKLERELHLKKGLHKQLNEAVAEAKTLRDGSGVRETEVQQLRESCSALASQLAAIKQRDQLQQLESMRQQQQQPQQQIQRQESQQQQQLDQRVTEQLVGKSEALSAPKEEIDVGDDALLNGLDEKSKDSSSAKEEANREEVTPAGEGGAGVDSGELEHGAKAQRTKSRLESDQSSNDTSSSAMTESIGSSDGQSSSDSLDCEKQANVMICEDDAPSAEMREISLVKLEDSVRNRYAFLKHMKEGDMESTSLEDVLARLGREGAPAGRCALLEYRLAQLSSTHSALVGRFQRAMKQVAELTEENQKLEVTMEQLQLENDTIGDYITIYQFKRGVMSQQMREKDLELDRLRGDRQTLIEKLAELQKLITLLVDERGGDCQGLANSVNNLLTAVTREAKVDENECKEGDESNDGGVKEPSSGDLPQPPSLELTNGKIPVPGSVSPVGEKKDGPKSETVTRIMSLIKEMEEAPTIDPRSLHPCGMCSGNLITV